MCGEVVYLGPLRFEIAYDDLFWDMHFPTGFDLPVGMDISASYKVQVCACGKMGPEKGKETADADEFKEYMFQGRATRDFYNVFDGVKRCYAKIELYDHKITVYFDTSHGWPKGKKREIWQFLMLEKLLAREGAIILHSASVMVNGGGILFSGLSGVGKSTQANLWKKYIPGTTGFNGDRNLLLRQNGIWYMCGFPWCGTSKEFRNGMVPLAGIALLKKGSEAEISELSRMEKFIRIYEQTTRNDWDRDYAYHVIDATDALTSDVPICELRGTKEEASVRCLENWLEIQNGTI